MSLKVVSDASTPKIIAVASGKGGVGKSTVALHLALALLRRGERVALLDADLYGPSIRKLIPEGTMPQKVSKTRITPAFYKGLFYISMAHFLDKDQPCVVRAPQANKIITQLIETVNWGPLDYLIIDFPPGSGDIHLTLAQKLAISGALLVTTPHALAVEDVKKSIGMFHRLKIPILGLVENMSYFVDPKSQTFIKPFGEGGADRICQEFEIKCLSKIPITSLYSEPASETKIFEIENELFTTLALLVSSALKSEDKREMQLTLEKPDKLKVTFLSGKVLCFTARELQRLCGCAHCQVGGAKVEADVKITNYFKAGHLGYRFAFSSGCSAGFYDEKLLGNI